MLNMWDSLSVKQQKLSQQWHLKTESNINFGALVNEAHSHQELKADINRLHTCSHIVTNVTRPPAVEICQLAAAAKKFTAAENPPEANAAGHNLAVKNN